VRDLRIEYDAVMVGAGTVRIDDPLLTVRPHASRHKHTRASSFASANRSRDGEDPPTAGDAPPGAYAPTIVLAPAGARAAFAELAALAEVIFVGAEADNELDLAAALRALRSRDVVSVLCEGGPTLAGRLLAARLVQRALCSCRFLRGDHAVPVLAGADLAGLTGGVSTASKPSATTCCSLPT